MKTLALMMFLSVPSVPGHQTQTNIQDYRAMAGNRPPAIVLAAINAAA